MKTLILNGSPKGESTISNTRRLIGHFTAAMTQDYEVRYIYKEKPEVLAKTVKDFDVILLFMPLYIHAMPSGVMAFIEHLSVAKEKNQAIGFIIQAGFPESAHEEIVCAYFKLLTKRLNVRYLGTVVKGGAAFIYRNPKNYQKLFEQFEALGKHFDETGSFDEAIKAELAMPYLFPKKAMCIIRLMNKFGVIDRDWKAIQKENHVLKQALDQPFL